MRTWRERFPELLLGEEKSNAAIMGAIVEVPQKTLKLQLPRDKLHNPWGSYMKPSQSARPSNACTCMLSATLCCCSQELGSRTSLHSHQLTNE